MGGRFQIPTALEHLIASLQHINLSNGLIICLVGTTADTTAVFFNSRTVAWTTV